MSGSKMNTDKYIYLAIIDNEGHMTPESQIDGISTMDSPSLQSFELTNITVTDSAGNTTTESVDTLALLFSDGQESGLSCAFINPLGDNPSYFLASLPSISSISSNPVLTNYGEYLYAGWTGVIDDEEQDLLLCYVSGVCDENNLVSWEQPAAVMTAPKFGCGLSAYSSSTPYLYCLYTKDKKDNLASQTMISEPGTYNVFCSETATVDDSETENNAAIVEFNGLLYACWADAKKGTIKMATMSVSGNNAQWSSFDTSHLNGSASSANPSLTVLDDQLYIAWSDKDCYGLIYAVVDTQGNWKGPYAIADDAASSGAGPALATYNNNVYIAWTVYNGNKDSTVSTQSVISDVLSAAGLVLTLAL